MQNTVMLLLRAVHVSAAAVQLMSCSAEDQAGADSMVYSWPLQMPEAKESKQQ
jgi:hypothetical protein